jgi:hypothetical protein
MPVINAIAKKDNLPYFKKGEKIKVIPILYKKDTLIVNEIYGLFKDDVFIKIFEKMDLKGNMKGLKVIKIADKSYAPKGSYKDSVIENAIGNRYPSSIVRSYQDYFEKV